MPVEVGSILEGKVVNIMPFGAFVSLPGGETGLVHISEVALEYVKNVSDHLKQDDTVRVKVIKIDESGKISLSIKKVLLEDKKASLGQAEAAPDSDMDSLAFGLNDRKLSFEDMLNKFKLDSDERIQALKRNVNTRRSGGYKRFSGKNY